jgi:hypothetical protein
MSPPAETSLDQVGRLTAIAGAGGEFKIGETQHTIEQLLIDPVSIQFQITGDTSVADQFYTDVLKSIEQAAQTKIDQLEQLVSTIQTLAVAQMDIDPWRFYSEEWKDFLKTTVDPIVATPLGTHRFWPQTFTTAVLYKMQSSDFFISPKPFTVEPRNGTTPDQKLFFVQSASDSKKHLDLMEVLERNFAPLEPKQES